jgi:hypothetical protein
LLESPNAFSAEDFEKFCTDFIGWKRRVNVWIVIFTLIVFLALFLEIRSRHAVSRNRTQQLQAIVDAGHKECLNAFRGMTDMWKRIVPDPSKLTPEQFKRFNDLLDAVDPKKNCPPPTAKTKILKKIQTSTDT